ncbi:protein L-Myc-1b-like isoform X2 [Mastacembelus armatus]|uniref:protein L-Myc-1b-like isoform X2 n=1 Tax=Mastacembelus armatus TaxID=205130 RepID=UPI000E45A08E|nr:protein L-Myc-1b-like isoform X2 [Mastacembelus armatus]
MEFDCYQHYFFDDLDTEEDFYKSTAPSEDIWKKFELLPTPPMSPTRTLNGAALHLSPGDKLSWLSKVLGQDEECEGPFIPDTEGLFGNLSSIIIQDCMWSSFSASKQLEKVNSRVAAAAQTSVSPVAQISVRPSKAQCVSPGGSLTASATDCVDPAAVFTFPASSCRKPASSGSESRSDSSDDDDEEEIDVVTVESKQSRVQLVNVRKPVTITVRADPCPKRFHMSVHRQQHNYAARSPDSEPEPEDEEEEEDDEEEEYEEEPQSKRVCTASAKQSSSSARVSQPASPSETPQNSDTEDIDRRRNHNFLERKRRHDLRSRFLALRDQIPGLESAKTPKVAILTQATEYLVELHTREKQQLQEKRRLKSRQQHLLRRLSELKRS